MKMHGGSYDAASGTVNEKRHPEYSNAGTTADLFAARHSRRNVVRDRD
jgi:hypothetical protein